MITDVTHCPRKTRGTACRAPALMLVLALFSSATQAQKPAWNIDRFMQIMRANAGGETGFSEKKYLSMLEAPLESSGSLRYRAPDLLEMDIVSPERQSIKLEHENLTITQADHNTTLNLNDYPELSALIGSIRSTLAGDRAALEQIFQVYLQGAEPHWKLILLPKAPDKIAGVRRISLAGETRYLRLVEIEMRDGDRSTIVIDKPQNPLAKALTPLPLAP
jgi:hypothetical protein